MTLTSDLVTSYQAANLMGVSYWQLCRMVKQNPTLDACSLKSGELRPTRQYSVSLLRAAGFLKETP